MTSTSTTATDSEVTPEQADALGESLVLARVFEGMLKKPDDDEDESSAGIDLVNKSISIGLAQGITGFGK